MAESLKCLAQSFPSSQALSTLYTVPALTSAVISTLFVCNQGSTAASFRVSVGVAGAADEAKQYIYYGEPVGPGKSFAATVGIALSATDVVRVWSVNGLLSFSLFGEELS